MRRQAHVQRWPRHWQAGIRHIRTRPGRGAGIAPYTRLHRANGRVCTRHGALLRKSSRLCRKPREVDGGRRSCPRTLHHGEEEGWRRALGRPAGRGDAGQRGIRVRCLLRRWPGAAGWRRELLVGAHASQAKPRCVARRRAADSVFSAPGMCGPRAVLARTEACACAQGCGEGRVAGRVCGQSRSR